MSCGKFHCLDKIASTRQDVKQTDFAFYGRFNGFLLEAFCLLVKCAIVLFGILITKNNLYSHSSSEKVYCCLVEQSNFH